MKAKYKQELQWLKSQRQSAQRDRVIEALSRSESEMERLKEIVSDTEHDLSHCDILQVSKDFIHQRFLTKVKELINEPSRSM